MNNNNILLKIRDYFEEQFLIRNSENDAKLKKLKEENDIKSKIIKTFEEKIMSLEKKLFQLGIKNI